MKLLERRRNLIGAFARFVLKILGKPPLTLEACVNDKSTIDYKVYGESVQDGTPTPDAPIEVESVGEKTVNLFDINNMEYIHYGSSYFYPKVEDGLFISPGKTGVSFYYMPVIKVEPSTTYVVSFKEVSGVDNRGIFLYDDMNKTNTISISKGTFIDSTRIFTLTTSDTSNYLAIGVSGANSYTAIISNIQIEKGNTFTEYEPYGKYKIPVVASGENLFDINQVTGFSSYNTNTSLVNLKDGVITCNVGAYGAGVWTLCNIKFLAKGTYTLSCDCRITQFEVGKDFYIGIVKRVDGAEKVVSKYLTAQSVHRWERFSFTFTLEEDTEIVGLQFQGVGDANTYMKQARQFKNIHLGTQEPITTNIYLDEPLRKIGDYADYIDFENQVVVRNIKKASLSIYGIYKKLSKVLKIHMTSYGLMRTKVLSTILPYDSSWNSNNEDIMTHTTTNNNAYYSLKWDRLGLTFDGTNVYLIDDSEKNKALTDTEIKSKVQEYLATLPAEQKELYFCIASTETPMKLPTLPTFKGTTIYSVDTNIQPSNMEVTYYSKERSVS